MAINQNGEERKTNSRRNGYKSSNRNGSTSPRNPNQSTSPPSLTIPLTLATIRSSIKSKVNSLFNPNFIFTRERRPKSSSSEEFLNPMDLSHNESMPKPIELSLLRQKRIHNLDAKTPIDTIVITTTEATQSA
jgi:hypothetical protein